MYDERKGIKDIREEKIVNNKEANKTETSNVSKLLSKGLERYDKALEKLSEN